MQALSPLQLLPYHVVQMIVDHLVGSTRILSRDVTPDSEEHKLSLLPLMWVSQNFRAVASVNFYRVNTVKFCGNDYYDKEATEYHWSRRLRKFFQYTHHLSQEVRIILNKPSVFYGRVVRGLSKVPCRNCTFSQARKLKFIFYASHAQKMDFYGEQHELPDQPWQSREHQQLGYEAEKAAKVDANLNAFIQQLKKMAPMVRESEVECGNIYVDRFPETQYFQYLLVWLFQFTPRVVHRIRSEAGPVDILADGVSNLVHIDIESGSIDPIAQLARQSAMTLQSLVIETRGYGDATGLFKDADSNYAEYPRLRVLKLKHYSEHYGSGKPVFPDLVPFPRLWHLTMDNYPFGDDVIFRENADTLEYLDLRADKDDITMFVEHSLFTPTSHPKLQYVKLGCYNGLVDSILATDKEYFQFLLSIGPNAAARKLPPMTWNIKRSTAVSLLGDYPSIQVLCLPSTHLRLWEAIAIIMSLPLLSDLHSESPILGRIPGKLTEEVLSAYVILKYDQIGKRFRCWHINRKSQGSFKETVVCVLLLALICPNFDYCVPPADRYNSNFMDLMKTTINSSEFRNHAPRLRRLLYTE